MAHSQIVHLYCLSWNEEAMLPFFLSHYSDLVDRFFIFDNGSTDRTLDMLKGDPRIEVSHFDVIGESFVAEEQRLSDTMWRASRGIADWVVIVDMDEMLFHPDLRAYLARIHEEGVTAVRAIGFDMVSEIFPPASRKLMDTVTRGVRSIQYDKPCIFNPSRIDETGFLPGRHGARPLGDVRWPGETEVALLHYKYMGLDYMVRRNAVLATGLKPRDHAMHWGTHYLLSPETVARQIDERLRTAERVPGLPGAPPHNMLGHEERLIRRSGLFDDSWYRAKYLDVARADYDPITHFHLYGWREGRRPNPHFDPLMFAKRYRLPANFNPLVAHILAETPDILQA